MSVLMDSCAIKYSSKSGLETLIDRNEAPHLLLSSFAQCYKEVLRSICWKGRGFIQGHTH